MSSSPVIRGQAAPRRRRHATSAVLATLLSITMAGCGGSSPPRPEASTTAKAGGWRSAGPLTEARGGQTQSLLADGSVLIAGGQLAAVYSALKTAEIFDPVTRKWKATGEMGANRSGHTATVLSTGKVLVTGGLVTNGGALHTTETFDPATGAWSPAASMGVARFNHTASPLPDGKVLVAGGYSLVDTPGLSSAEVYDPAADTWSPTAPMVGGRGIHTATVLADGKVLVAAGNELGVFRRTATEATSTTVTNGLASVTSNGSGEVTTAELYDPATKAWSATGQLKKGRSAHTATMLKDSKVLVVGGFSPSGELDSAELYDPAAGTWALTAPLTSPRTIHTAALLPDGQVLVAGGQVGAAGSILSSTVATAALYDPVSAKWKPAADMGTPRTGHTSIVLASGQVLVTGGVNANGPVADSELYSVKAKAAL